MQEHGYWSLFHAGSLAQNTLLVLFWVWLLLSHSPFISLEISQLLPRAGVVPLHVTQRHSVTQTCCTEGLITQVCLPGEAPLRAGAPWAVFLWVSCDSHPVLFSRRVKQSFSRAPPQHINPQKKWSSLGDVWLGCNTPHTTSNPAILHCPTHKAHLSLVLLQQSRLEPIDYTPIYVMKVLYYTKTFFKKKNPISPQEKKICLICFNLNKMASLRKIK